MAGQTQPFTTLSVKSKKPKAERQEIPDPGCRGLCLVVQPAGAKSWAFRYRFNGKPKKLTIGPVYLGKDEPEEVRLDHPNTLAGARKLAGEAALLVAKGIDPAKHKKREKLRRGYGPEMPSCLIGTLLKPSPIYSLKNTPKRTPKSEAGLRQPD